MDTLTSEAKALSQFLHNCSKAREGKQKELSYQLRCLECGAATTPVPSCECRGHFDYIAPGELAEWAVRIYPDMSDRAIADKFKISDTTVLRARKAGASKEAPEKRTGKDGKRYSKKRKNSPKQEAAAASAVLDAGTTLEQAKDAAGLGSVQGVKTGIAYEQGRRDAFAEIGADADFSKITAQQKRDAALRTYAKELDRQFEQRVQAEYTARVKKSFPELNKMQREAAEEKRDYERLSRERKHIMSVENFSFICSCLHPDSRDAVTNERLLRAFQMFRPKKFVLTGEE